MTHINPLGIKNVSPYFGYMAMLNTNNGLLFNPQTCKETFVCAVGNELVFDRKSTFGYNARWDGRIDRERPKMVIFFGKKNDKKYSRKEAILRVYSSLAVFNRVLGLPLPYVDRLQGVRAFVVRFDPWYLRSSVSLHFILTIIRASAIFKDIPLYLNSGDKKKDAWEIIDFIVGKDSSHHADSNQMTQALSAGNITGIINKTLPCVNREGYTDWHYGNQWGPCWPGIAGYLAETDLSSWSKLDVKKWLSETYRQAPGENYRNWYAQYNG